MLGVSYFLKKYIWAVFLIVLVSGGKIDNLNGHKKRIYNILSVILNSGIWWVVFFKPIIKTLETNLFEKFGK